MNRRKKRLDEGKKVTAADDKYMHLAEDMLYQELGVGYNTPSIIKYPFWQMTAKNPKAIYACVNFGEAVCPEDIREQAICIDGDIGTVIDELRK